KFDLRDGMEAVCRGRLEVYPPSGRYQFIISQIEPKGVGALELAFRQLQEKLAREGLFAPERKKPRPRVIRRIGVATSATGAALRDFLNILGRRAKRVDVVIAPTKVQGEGAALDVVRALKMLNDAREALRLDAIALIRGGGSSEDLWTFNEEIVVRAVAASRLYVATGLGHEIDVSLCDLAADLHALTPSDAAARLVPEDDVARKTFDEWRTRMRRAVDLRLQRAEERLARLASSRAMTAPGEILTEKRGRKLTELELRLNKNADDVLARAELKMATTAAKLEALSPIAALARGYSLTTRKRDGALLRRAADVEIGEIIETRLAEGTIRSVVVE
ncbi:MAG: exodeoxyribonuclease VII large subunit, partial [Thermoguttaceae bacterium]|nr:exodeoxyribonuclease VII large subunit [Thermoguttaceae bacterium]